ncbi:MAG: BspA family leucine-rich repeat surface protein, partial [Corynebacterium sp.]|nr:BspA family leucine-rich repeat surface protein [Corynebacterium sp.]
KASPLLKDKLQETGTGANVAARILQAKDAVQFNHATPSSYPVGVAGDTVLLDWEPSGVLTLHGSGTIDDVKLYNVIAHFTSGENTSAGVEFRIQDPLSLSPNAAGLFWHWKGTITGTEKLDTSNVIDMSYMFNGAENIQIDVSTWDTSNVTAMDRMFQNNLVNNPDVSGWNTSKVTSMNGIFYYAASASPDVSSWDTRNVVDMSNLFRFAFKANPDVKNWDVSNLKYVVAMFEGNKSAYPDFSNWVAPALLTGTNASQPLDINSDRALAIMGVEHTAQLRSAHGTTINSEPQEPQENSSDTDSTSTVTEASATPKTKSFPVIPVILALLLAFSGVALALSTTLQI